MTKTIHPSADNPKTVVRFLYAEIWKKTKCQVKLKNISSFAAAFGSTIYCFKICAFSTDAKWPMISRASWLNTDAKTLYSILLDRMGLSAKNGLIITRFSTVAIFRPESAAFLNRNCWSSCIRNSTVLSPWIITATACLSAM